MRTGLLVLALGLAMAAGAAQAEGISGVFQTQANDKGDVGMVRFAPCGDRWCGTLVKSFNGKGQEVASPNRGRTIVGNMVDEGGGKFSGGTIWDPGADKTYTSKMVLNGDVLKVSGCVSIICRSQTWRRVR